MPTKAPGVKAPKARAREAQDDQAAAPKDTGAKKPNALQQPLRPSAELAAVVGPGPLSRGEVVSKVWEYIKRTTCRTRRTAARSWPTRSSRRCSARRRRPCSR
jgi:chromatin remodeling complex protein RSC6